MGRARTGKSERVLQRIAALGDSSQQILLVPEHASHVAEMDLCRVCGDTASRHAEALTFKLLASRVLSICGGSADVTLDSGGKLLTLQRTLTELAPVLKVYKRPSQRAAFLESLLAVMEELQAYVVLPEQLSESVAQIEGESGDKLRDLSLIYGIYLSKLHAPGHDARDVLEKAFGPQTAQALFEKITKQFQTKAFAFVRKADYKNLLAMVQNEHPQTIALILSYARSDQASAILSELPKKTRIDVVERMAKMDRASPDVVKSIERTLEKKFDNLVTADSTEVGGIDYVAEVMNNVDRATEKYIFDELTLRDPKLADDIRSKMFVFEDIVTLDNMAIQAFIPEVDSKDLAVAIKGSTPEVAECIYANMSTRMRESVQTDVEYLHNVRMRDVEEAQQRIVSIIRRLEDEGTLVISKGGKEDEIIA